MLLDLLAGLEDAERVTEVGEAASSPCAGGVVATGGVWLGSATGGGVGVWGRSPLESCLEGRFRGISLVVGDDVGVGELESLCDVESWDIKERT